MMESETEISSKTLAKNYIKTLPVWSYCDEFRANLELLEYNVKSFLDNLNSCTERVRNLPFLNVTNQPRVLPYCEAKDDMDVVRVYRKTNEGYKLFDKVKFEELRKRAQADPYRDESILMLEEKVHVNEEVFSTGKPCEPWIKCRVVSVFYKASKRESINEPMITFRLKPTSETHSRTLDVNKYCVARVQDHRDLLKASKRVIAGLNTDDMRSGIIGEEPTETNKHRYLVHMDDGTAHYFQFDQVLPILGQTPCPWQDIRRLGVENPVLEAHLRYIFSLVPQRQLMKIKPGEQVKVKRNGTFVTAEVLSLDKSIMKIKYKDGHIESIYRGSPRLANRGDLIARQLKNQNDLTNFNQRLLLHMHLYHEASKKALDEDCYKFWDDPDKRVLISKNHGTARKSTAMRSKSPERIKVNLDGKVVPDNRNSFTLPGDRKHACTPECLNVPGIETELSINDIIDDFRETSDLKVPLMFGWKRSLSRIPNNNRTGKTKLAIVYRSPCGRVFQVPHLLRRHLLQVGSKFDIDYFTFEREVELNRSIGMSETYTYVRNIAVDPKTQKPSENKYISLMNQFSEERLPDDFEYRNQSFPHPLLKAKNFSFNHEFKSGCDCEDDCQQRSTCDCHNLNEEFFRKKRHLRGTVESRCQYNNKRLNEQVATGIFECNSYCKCSSKCSNRVVQNGMRFRLQVRKTLSKGWGVITLDDIPRGAFICTYAAELLDDADQYGDSDMYYADLDYISVNEELKFNLSDSDEGVGKSDSEEVKLQQVRKKGKGSTQTSIGHTDDEIGSQKVVKIDDTSDSSSSSSSTTEEGADYLPQQRTIGQSRYPKRKQKKAKKISNQAKSNGKAKFLKIHDILNTHDYTLDARMQGNVGRFFNHSCDPNSTVQNVFIETQDLRFPQVAFFALKTIKAMEEITWNYNYKMGSIDGRIIECHCGASNCRGRIL